ncbi:MAG: hypothetical protein ABIP51_11615 [Bacteroidia bacterium]
MLHSADIEELKTLESELKTKQNFTFSSLSISDDETDEAIIKYKSNLK